ncbi:NUDIX hydrolase [Microaerobacter geothermalis]|uniref:NUDIX hydrolase n=1 Tax=Microaerobacter geothermalis TaxID=674972 RepID=UPI001F3F86FC|nr:NUDIX hydrolase [Microaerobacter geothermalis]MCF6094256.1 NUDIX hydrolase [Microaerobacter geothermalis]
MYIKESELRGLEKKYGTPAVIHCEFHISSEEMDMVHSSSMKKHGRSHDFTVFIFNFRGNLAMIQKPSYPPDAYRPPSGGINLNEDLEKGILREVKEETGLSISLEYYLAKVLCELVCDERTINWTTHVFTAIGDGVIQPIDTHEISGAKWGSLDELNGPIRKLLLKTGRGLFRYRVFLHDQASRLLKERRIIRNLSGEFK